MVTSIVEGKTPSKYQNLSHDALGSAQEATRQIIPLESISQLSVENLASWNKAIESFNQAVAEKDSAQIQNCLKLIDSMLRRLFPTRYADAKIKFNNLAATAFRK